MQNFPPLQSQQDNTKTKPTTVSNTSMYVNIYIVIFLFTIFSIIFTKQISYQRNFILKIITEMKIRYRMNRPIHLGKKMANILLKIKLQIETQDLVVMQKNQLILKPHQGRVTRGVPKSL